MWCNGGNLSRLLRGWPQVVGGFFGNVVSGDVRRGTFQAADPAHTFAEGRAARPRLRLEEDAGSAIWALNNHAFARRTLLELV